MIKISLTDFIDVVSKSGSSKATKVASIKSRPEYTPAQDFYKGLRDKIIEVIGDRTGKADLDDAIKDAHSKKRVHFKENIDGFRKWWGRKELVLFDPIRGLYGEGGITVSINPELSLYINGSPYLVKLYFKTDKLPKNHASISTHLMKIALSKNAPKETKMAILDVRRAKFFEYDVPHPKLDAALRGELAYVEALWDNI